MASKEVKLRGSGGSSSLGRRVTVRARHTGAASSPKLTELPKQTSSHSSTHEDSAQGEGDTQQFLRLCRREGCSDQCCKKMVLQSCLESFNLKISHVRLGMIAHACL